MFRRPAGPVGLALWLTGIGLVTFSPEVRAEEPALRAPGAAAAPTYPAPPPIARITFDEAIRRALERNPTVAVARAEVQRADALVEESRAGWYPTLLGNGAYTRRDHDRPATWPAGQKQDQLFGNGTLTVPVGALQSW